MPDANFGWSGVKSVKNVLSNKWGWVCYSVITNRTVSQCSETSSFIAPIGKWDKQSNIQPQVAKRRNQGK